MKNCPNCNAPVEDNAAFCSNCGAPMNGQAAYQPPYQPPAPPAWDHTAEFDGEDVSQNKIFALGCYALSIIGILIALLGGRNSGYAMFHIREAMKLTVVEAIVSVVSLLLCWTVVVPLLGLILLAVLFVVQVIAFVEVCQNKAREPWLIRSLKFL